MNIFILVWNYLKARPLNTGINIILLSLGIAVITLLLIFNQQLEQKITENAKGIDLVVGAKGSPLQLILCNIFHIDFPTGNIKLNEAEKIAKNRLVKKAIPLALGDSYQNYRIIGTTQAYPELYHAKLSEGTWFKKDLDVTIGSNVAALGHLKTGDHFASAHGLIEGGGDHGEHAYNVVGIMQPSHTVLDNLILTNVGSVWMVHEAHDTASIKEHHPLIPRTPSILIPSIASGDSLKEITSMLIQYRSPMGAVQMPRMINSQTNLQAASPAFETARLFTILGVGVEVLMGFAYVLIVISGLSIFIALYNSLKERRYDMAIMRAMGATRGKLLLSVLLEGGTLTLLGSLLGVILGHGVVELLSSFSAEAHKSGITGFVFLSQEWILLAGSLLLGLICALIPAVQAYRTDISKVLAGGA
jgi:putative ABC transport system permease protein